MLLFVLLTSTCAALAQPVVASTRSIDLRLPPLAFTSVQSSAQRTRQVRPQFQFAKLFEVRKDGASDGVAPKATQADIHVRALPPSREGYRIAEYYSIPSNGFPDDPSSSGLFRGEDVERLGLTASNMTLPSALMVLDPARYGDLSRSLKACRDGSIVLHRGPLLDDDKLDPKRSRRGRVGDRVYSGDVVARRERIEGTTCAAYAKSTKNVTNVPFELPVLYEDDHVCVVNKPGGVSLYPHKDSTSSGGNVGENHRVDTIRDALPRVLKAPRDGTGGVLWRPEAAHRLDKETSGLLVIAKTKPALADLARQFAQRSVFKTYSAICWGRPANDDRTCELDTTLLNEDALVGAAAEPPWQVMDLPLDGKQSVTFWRTLREATHAEENGESSTLSLVELRPKTGRYRQLRRHMARLKGCPLVGDQVYGHSHPPSLRDLGLFLCSTHISFQHPYYKGSLGRQEWEDKMNDESSRRSFGSVVGLEYDKNHDRVMVTAQIDLPDKFNCLMRDS